MINKDLQRAVFATVGMSDSHFSFVVILEAESTNISAVIASSVIKSLVSIIWPLKRSVSPILSHAFSISCPSEREKTSCEASEPHMAGLY
jgi:hypothetical protein